MTDVIYNYKGFHGFDSKCRIRIFNTKDKDVIIATELKDNPGTSITNFSQYLATLIIHEYDIDPERLFWVEHYPSRKYGSDKIEDESYDLVKFEWAGSEFIKPEWKHSSKNEIENIIGELLQKESYLLLQ